MIGQGTLAVTAQITVNDLVGNGKLTDSRKEISDLDTKLIMCLSIAVPKPRAKIIRNWNGHRHLSANISLIKIYPRKIISSK